jgi:hypothetical protein
MNHPGRHAGLSASQDSIWPIHGGALGDRGGVGASMPCGRYGAPAERAVPVVRGCAGQSPRSPRVGRDVLAGRVVQQVPGGGAPADPQPPRAGLPAGRTRADARGV